MTLIIGGNEFLKIAYHQGDMRGLEMARGRLIMTKNKTSETLSESGLITQLREYYQTVLSEPIPDELKKLIEQLRVLSRERSP